VERWSARRWIARIMISWGVLTVFMAVIHTSRQFYVVRFLVGAAEARLPAWSHHLTSHIGFRYQDRAKAVAFFYAANPLSYVIGSPLAGYRNQLRALGEFERDHSARIEVVFLEVVEEKIPFVDLPQIFRLVSVEADLVSGNDVKTPAETRQVLVRLNSEIRFGKYRTARSCHGRIHSREGRGHERCAPDICSNTGSSRRRSPDPSTDDLR